MQERLSVFIRVSPKIVGENQELRYAERLEPSSAHSGTPGTRVRFGQGRMTTGELAIVGLDGFCLRPLGTDSPDSAGFLSQAPYTVDPNAIRDALSSQGGGVALRCLG
jgi:hypothetical protein